MIVILAPLLLTVDLPIKLTNSNDGRGHSFWRTNEDRTDCAILLKSLGHVYSPIDFPVYVRVTRLYSGLERKWDYSGGLRGNYKEIEDSLVACGWFVDDGPKWIKGVVFAQEKGEVTATRIEIFDGR